MQRGAFMFVQLVHIRVKPGKIDEFFEVFRENFEGTRKEPGNFRFDVLQEPEDAHHFVIYEAFENKEAVDAHRLTDHYKATVKGLAEIMATGTREKEYFQMVMPDHASALNGA